MVLTPLLLVPLLTSGACFLVKRRHWLELMTVASTFIILVLAGVAAGVVLQSGHIGELADWLYADALSAVILLVIAFVSLAVAIYSIGYLREDMREQDVTQGERLRGGRTDYDARV